MQTNCFIIENKRSEINEFRRKLILNAYIKYLSESILTYSACSEVISTILYLMFRRLNTEIAHVPK